MVFEPRALSVGLVLSLAVLLLSLSAGLAAQKEVFTFTYLQREDDPAYEPNRAYTGLVLRDRHPGLQGIKTGLRESRVLGRALGIKFELNEVSLEAGQSAVALIRERMGGDRVFLLDLPLEEMEALARELADEELLLFNFRHPDDHLRDAGCSPVLFHTLPSLAMVSEATAQFLRKRNWLKVLLLEGAEPADLALSEAFVAAAKKFQLNVVARRSFVLSNDPRQRDRTNVPLLTAAGDYDVIFLADSLGEFGRYVPFSTQLPRPVVGTEGLVAGARHWAWERHGAPQLNQRFDRIAKRLMQDQDWAAWAAVKATVEALVRARSTRFADLLAMLRSEDFLFDLYKGAPGSFRPWNNQLRQPILLHTHNAVIERAPLEGFLHQFNELDTLGKDQAESGCGR